MRVRTIPCVAVGDAATVVAGVPGGGGSGVTVPGPGYGIAAEVGVAKAGEVGCCGPGYGVAVEITARGVCAPDAGYEVPLEVVAVGNGVTPEAG